MSKLVSHLVFSLMKMVYVSYLFVLISFCFLEQITSRDLDALDLEHDQELQ
jgi:hypothetical protein